MKAKTLEEILQLLVPTTINADGAEVEVLNTQNGPSCQRDTNKGAEERRTL